MSSINKKFNALSVLDKKLLVLAPMAGYTDQAFRQIVSDEGCNLTVTEMISLKGIFYDDAVTKQMLNFSAHRKVPCFCQIFCHEPDIIPYTVDILNALEHIDGIDFNMGCPAPKIVKNGDGSALMDDLDLAERIIKKLIQYAQKPVSIKFRLGTRPDSENFLKLGKICEFYGVSFVTLHARYACDFYRGFADWEKIKTLKKNLEIPVIGNGDIQNREEALQRIAEGYCDGVAMGRAALHNPFVFKGTEPSQTELLKIILKNYRLKEEYMPRQIAVHQMRKQTAYYLKGLTNSAMIKQKIFMEEDFNEVERILISYLGEDDD